MIVKHIKLIQDDKKKKLIKNPEERGLENYTRIMAQFTLQNKGIKKETFLHNLYVQSQP